MKKIRLILSAILMMTAFGFIACSHSASGSNSSSGSNNTSSVTDGIRLQNGATKQVGDIILNDGTVLRDVTSVSDADKAKAIAVIYKVDGQKAYGVGLVHNKNGLKWCLESANGYNTNFTDLQCEVSGSPINPSFTGDTDGSDNFEKIAQALGADNDTETAENYPAFYFAKNYKNQTNSHVSGTAYENGWYLPTIAEFLDISHLTGTVESKSNLCGGSQFDLGSQSNSSYWTSSQKVTLDNYAQSFCITTGAWSYGRKDDDMNVCCIRVFE